MANNGDKQEGESAASGPRSNPELEGYIAGLEYGPAVRQYGDDERVREWERGYERGQFERRRDDRQKSRESLRERILWGLLLVTVGLAGFMVGHFPEIYVKSQPNQSTKFAVGDRAPSAQPDLSRVEDRLDRLNTNLERSCQPQSITLVPPGEVRTAVTEEQKPIVSSALDVAIQLAGKSGTAVIKDAVKFKEQIQTAVIDSTQKIAESTADALIKRYIAKEGEKALPGNVQITVTQNNAPTPAVRAPGRPISQTSLCTLEKK
jgi:hypothetical protein